VRGMKRHVWNVKFVKVFIGPLFAFAVSIPLVIYVDIVLGIVAFIVSYFLVYYLSAWMSSVARLRRTRVELKVHAIQSYEITAFKISIASILAGAFLLFVSWSTFHSGDIGSSGTGILLLILLLGVAAICGALALVVAITLFVSCSIIKRKAGKTSSTLDSAA
jgi:hypothetical protein